jgi:hypothetical protein
MFFYDCDVGKLGWKRCQIQALKTETRPARCGEASPAMKARFGLAAFGDIGNVAKRCKHIIVLLEI